MFETFEISLIPNLFRISNFGFWLRPQPALVSLVSDRLACQGVALWRRLVVKKYFCAFCASLWLRIPLRVENFQGVKCLNLIMTVISE